MFNPGILMRGGVLQIISDTVVGAALVVTASLVLHGYVRSRTIPVWLRGILVILAFAMAIPQPLIQYGAVAAAVVLYLVLRGTERPVTPASRPGSSPAA